jgi:hypothetical protein
MPKLPAIFPEKLARVLEMSGFLLERGSREAITSIIIPIPEMRWKSRFMAGIFPNALERDPETGRDNQGRADGVIIGLQDSSPPSRIPDRKATPGND